MKNIDEITISGRFSDAVTETPPQVFSVIITDHCITVMKF